MPFRIALDAGHGINTAGKRCLSTLDKNSTREWMLNDRVCDHIERLLKGYGGYDLIRVDDFDDGNDDISLSARTAKANTWEADLYLSVHHNAGVNGGSGGGIVAYAHPRADESTFEWRDEFYDSLIRHTGLKGNRWNGTLTADFQVLRQTKMTAVLLELGFMDSSTDVPIILTDFFALQCAKAIVEVIVKKAKLYSNEADKEYVQEKCGLADETIEYLSDYKYAKDLFMKIRKAIENG